jgi:hypothetical protein
MKLAAIALAAAFALSNSFTFAQGVGSAGGSAGSNTSGSVDSGGMGNSATGYDGNGAGMSTSGIGSGAKTNIGMSPSDRTNTGGTEVNTSTAPSATIGSGSPSGTSR